MDRPGTPHREENQDRVSLQLLCLAQRVRRTLRTASFTVTVLYLDILATVTSVPIAELLAGAFVVGLLLLLAGAITIVLLDAFAEILDEDGIGILDDAHSDSSILSP